MLQLCNVWIDLSYLSSARGQSLIGHDDSGPNLQIITGRWEMRSVTKRRWMVIPRKPSGCGDTPHEMCTCDRNFLYKAKSDLSPGAMILEEYLLLFSLYLPQLPGRDERCNGENDMLPLSPRTSTT